MSGKRKPLTNKSGEVRSLTRDDFSHARPLKEAFPELAAYSRRRARAGEPKKQAVSIRLSPEVLSFFKEKGAGWQTRIDRALQAFVDAAK
ncbi:MAG: BrnA antitoxin family protein [Alphaproteobacteria bacterium]|nr:BrnA antitoxin family protein [Alphaproteobacteria bacterium]